MPTRRIATVLSPFLTFVDWMFGPLVPFVDVFLGLLALSWLGLMVGWPNIFDHGNQRGMQWLPDEAWMGFLALTVALHAAGLAQIRATTLRFVAALLSSWFWLLVAISFSRVGLSTGNVVYGLIGTGALMAAVYISGRIRPAG